jgi:hypothetical protein
MFVSPVAQRDALSGRLDECETSQHASQRRQGVDPHQRSGDDLTVGILRGTDRHEQHGPFSS